MASLKTNCQGVLDPSLWELRQLLRRKEMPNDIGKLLIGLKELSLLGSEVSLMKASV